jgi:predicted O-methyltransferase YrrM
MKSASAVTRSDPDKHAQGVQLFEECRFAEAFVALGDALRRSTNPPWHLWNDWGAAAFACKEMEKAEAGLKHAYALNEKSAEVVANLGSLLVSLDRAAEALPYLELAAAHSTEPQSAAVEQLLVACRERSQAQPAVPPGNQNFLTASLVSCRASAAPTRDRYWFSDITGWFLPDEALHLFTAVQLAQPARILEIGTFYGRSTATICSAIKSFRKPIEFITCDLDFASAEEFVAWLKGVNEKGPIRAPVEFHEAFALGASTLIYAHRELLRHGLADYVQFVAGDFREIPGKFDLIFADVLHDRAEIERNLAAIVDKLNPEGILAVHDLTPEHMDVIRRVSGALRFISKHELLGLYRIE